MKQRIFPNDLVLEPISQFQFLPEIPGFPKSLSHIFIYNIYPILHYSPLIAERRDRDTLRGNTIDNRWMFVGERAEQARQYFG